MTAGRTAAALMVNTLHRTVEWSQSVAMIQSELQNVSQFVLPDLPSVITPELEREFFRVTCTPARRIQTIATGRYENHNALRKRVKAVSSSVDTILLVGGNTRNHVSTPEAIRVACDNTNSKIWCVANPNRREDTNRLHQKIDAGATGVITQPLFTQESWSTLEHDFSGLDATVLVGMAFPKSAKSLLFWLDLLEQPEQRDDALMKEHLDYFSQGKKSLPWIQGQIDRVAQTSRADGIHCMALNNTLDLLSILQS